MIPKSQLCSVNEHKKHECFCFWVRQNIQFARSLNLTCIQFTPITAFPGTEFYNWVKKNNFYFYC